MNEAEQAKFAALIRARLMEIERENALGQDGRSVVQLDQQSVGRLSRMDALQNQAMAKAQQARRDLESRRLRAALARIDEGEFGWCEDCGEEIPIRRLELDPAATRCVSCAAG
ncbi:TraR/DksA family transcriptional regulator [Jhaorihella thermophila]|uniref:TraR/DksA family transcriptional regulator n=1 Tax=Jhaorihella thermophila TaxID=488547 RepID=UPI001F20EE8F|nr:TraR/DksA C4-type zinc finger protein [Jhaorihella thermophila]